jgi:mono/diheme cytochrome c family protein
MTTPLNAKRCLYTLCLPLVLAVSTASAMGSQDLVVNENQATRGKAIYDEMCSGCHGADLNGGNASELHGGIFIIHWGGKPASELFAFIRENMPAGAPGSLHSDDYRDVLATILEAIGYTVTADASEINRDTDLAALTIEDKTKK